MKTGDDDGVLNEDDVDDDYDKCGLKPVSR